MGSSGTDYHYETLKRGFLGLVAGSSWVVRRFRWKVGYRYHSGGLSSFRYGRGVAEDRHAHQSKKWKFGS